LNLLVINLTHPMAEVGESCFSGGIAHFFGEREFREVAGADNGVRIVEGKDFGLPSLWTQANERQQAVQVRGGTAQLALLSVSSILGGTLRTIRTWLRRRRRGGRRTFHKKTAYLPRGDPFIPVF